MSRDAYSGGNRVRVAAAAGAWTPVVIPAGARDFLLTMEDSAATWRMTTNNADPLAGGTGVGAGGGVVWRGTAAADTTVYVNPSANTTAFGVYQTDA